VLASVPLRLNMLMLTRKKRALLVVIELKLVTLSPLINLFAELPVVYLRVMAVNLRIVASKGVLFTTMLPLVLFGLKIKFLLVQTRQLWAKLVLSNGFGTWLMLKSSTITAIMVYSLRRNIVLSA
jgi:hypothetical protein